MNICAFVGVLIKLFTQVRSVGHIWIINQFNGDHCLLKCKGMENGLGLAVQEHTDT